MTALRLGLYHRGWRDGAACVSIHTRFGGRDVFFRVIGFVLGLGLVLLGGLFTSGQQLLLTQQRLAPPEHLGASAKAALAQSELLVCRYLGAHGAQVVVARFDPTNQTGIGRCPLLRASNGSNPFGPRAG
jgi:hypothetical protein